MSRNYYKSPRPCLAAVLLILLLALFGCVSRELEKPFLQPVEKVEEVAQKIAVKLTAEDGVALAGIFYSPGPQPSPTVLLLHMLDRSKADWDAFASALLERDIAALAIDLRGHGESEGNWRAFGETDFRAMELDVKAAIAWLREQRSVDAARIAIIGASIGANIALNYASRDSAIKTVVLLSPGLNYRGVSTESTIMAYDRSLLVVASEGDDYSARSSRELYSRSPLAPEQKTLVIYSGAAHGTKMLVAEPALEGLLLAWLEERL